MKNTKNTITPLKPAQTQKRRPPKNISTKPQKLVFKVPECAEHYFSAIVNPFDTAAGACIPCDVFPLPSQKTKTTIRGRFQLGTSGVGWITVTPRLSKDEACVYYTTAASVGTSATISSAFTNSGSAQMSQLPYTASAFVANGIAGRIVAGGLRIKYVSSLMNRNGNVLEYEEPDHQIVTGYSYDTLSGNPYARVKRVGGEEWDASTQLSGPVTPSEMEFVHNSTAPIGGPLCLYVSGAASDLYEFEYVQHTEFIGSSVPGKTKSHSDPQTTAKVLEVVKSHTSSGPVSPASQRSLWDEIGGAISDTLPKLVSAGASIATGVISGNGGAILDGAMTLLAPSPKRDVPMLGWH